MDAAAFASTSGRRAEGPAEVGQLVRSELVGRPARGDPRLPERLVGEQVPDAGDDGLVEQPRLDGGVTPT